MPLRVHFTSGSAKLNLFVSGMRTKFFVPIILDLNFEGGIFEKKLAFYTFSC